MLKRIALYTLSFFFLYVVGIMITFGVFSNALPDIAAWNFEPKRLTKVFSNNGNHLHNFLEENREIISYEELPKSMQDALLSIEDQRYFSHWGIDIRRILGAIIANIQSFSPTAQGASTITQQLARNVFVEEVGNQRSSASWRAIASTYARKIREQITSIYIERLYTKQEILTMYLNKVYFGHGAHGLKAAAGYFFDKRVSDLSIEESALLAGLLKAPNGYSPLRKPNRAFKRRNQVLYSMVQNGKLSKRSYNRIRQIPIKTRIRNQLATYGSAPYFVEHVRQQLQQELGNTLYRAGYTIHTTLDSRLQDIAEKYYRKEIDRVEQNVNRYLSQQDSSAGLPDSAIVQAAFIAIDPHTGQILALIGGRNFGNSKFNRATQAKRQPGSAFKPFVYTAAIDNNRFTTEIIEDNAITLYDQSTGEFWDPENYDKKFLGPMTLRDGLKQSRNLIALRLTDDIGPNLIRRYARNMGITTPVKAIPSIGIGTSEVTLIDMVAAYSVYPNKGIYIEPYCITAINDNDGNELFRKISGNKREVLRPAAAVIVTDMMRSVMDEIGGTGRGARTRHGFKTAAAGKTGTTNDYTDAWFIGFTPHLVAGVWVGIDNPSLRLWPRQAGSSAALPMWALFMKEVYSAVPKYRARSKADFDYPENLVTELSICSESYKLATRFCPNHDKDLFIKNESLPTFCPLHGGQNTSPAGSVQRF
ncbi:MAG: PBP1A family penicillin-binding protein [Candidatus Latescibacterota bacterium]|nr:PBP1A family penicillin-binding protein [Candidatus Latescibacterota bacterium]